MTPGSIRSHGGRALAAAAVLLLTAELQPVQAACTSARIITTFATITDRSYFYTPGTCPGGFGNCGFPYYSSVTGYIQGDFWAIGYGDKADTNGGIDNGPFPEDTLSSYYISPYYGWITSAAYFYPAAINTAWSANAGINGCPDDVVGTKCMGVLVSDSLGLGPGGLNDAAYFAFLTDEADEDGNYNFGQGGGVQINLAPIPVPSITSTTPSLSAIDVDVEVPTPTGSADGLYLDAACDSLNPILGYRIYGQTILEGAPLPSSRDIAQWTALSPTVPFGQPSALTVPCANNELLVLAASLVFDSDYETEYVSKNAIAVECCSAPDDDGDLICADFDCDDTNPNCTTDCTDTDLDGFCVTTDCDDAVASCVADCTDRDSDGLALCAGDCDDANAHCTTDCTDSDLDGFCVTTDCADGVATIYPGAPQICDRLNNDCSDQLWPQVPPNEVDADGDTFTACEGDCVEGDSTVYPGAPQLCDAINNDCNAPEWPAVPLGEQDNDGDSVAECEGDCDDSLGEVFPGAPQVCDGINNDCNDPAWPGVPSNESNADGDDYRICEGDCDDSLDDVYPSAPQLCDGINNDCDEPSWPAIPVDELDSDADDFRPCEGDCNDADGVVFPGATEICNTVDDDCNDLIDDDELGEDTDSDGVHNVCDNCRDVINPSQGDTDGDLKGNSCDNCIFDPNPGQEDFDLDQRGDICDNCPTEYNAFQDDFDLDGFGDVCDNCPFDPYPSQSDTDADFEGDWCDFDDGLIYVTFSTPGFVEWQAETGFDSWNGYRGDLETLKNSGIYTQTPGSNILAAQICGRTNPWAQDPNVPLPARVAFYLITGVAAGVENSLGTDSFDIERPNDNPCP